jgi:2-oxoglutarate dehydrogenase E2 component (dihydrolipoamide succinyltransferase)
MSIEIVVPTLGESISEATVAKWFKNAGESVTADEPVVELETDKVTLEVPAPAGGAIGEIRAAEGANVEVGSVLGFIEENGSSAISSPPTSSEPTEKAASTDAKQANKSLSPAVRRLVREHGLDVSAIIGTGKDGRLTKADVLAAVSEGPPANVAPPKPETKSEAPSPAPRELPKTPMPKPAREERVRMSRLRQRIAERLKQAQNTAAILSTFNEVDMSHVIAARQKYREVFEKKHGVRLGFMAFFVKAATLALRELPAVNAEIDGDEIVYKNYYHIGIAVGSPQGLVVPVLREADRMNFAEIERAVADFAQRARDGKLALEELAGGTFTITNGGIFGSLLSTPIINPPQSAILGMHKIQQRPVVVDGSVVPRPMMYLALSYDHRIIDGREAVSFLVRVKECLEDPQRLILDV